MTLSALKKADHTGSDATDNAGARQAAVADDHAASSSLANINPRTGLATDYLNHFNEAIMLLDMIPDMPDCTDDFLNWQPLTYCEHFAASHFKGREIAISAYNSADPAIRAEFDNIISTMTSILTTVGAAMREVKHQETRAILAEQAAGWVKPLVTLAGAMINAGNTEADIDRIMNQ